MIDKLMRMFQDHLRAKHEIVFYSYQLDVAERLFSAVIKNLQLTIKATPKEIDKLKQVEIPIEFSRQAGKTTTVVYCIDFMMIFFPTIFNRSMAIGIFAPQKEQAKTDFDRLKNALAKSTDLTVVDDESAIQAKEESNAKTIVLPNGASCYIFPVTKTSKPESKTLDLIIFEESQDLDDNIITEQIFPMGKFTNAPRAFIGTAGVKKCYFLKLVRQSDALVLDFDRISAEKQKAYEQTGNPIHLIYIKSVNEDIQKYGRDADEIRRPYYLEWIIGTGQFVTEEKLDAMVDPDRKRRTYQEKKHECFAGIDTAKNPDSTVVTVVRYNQDKGKKELINWLELRGDNYKDQYDIIAQFLSNYNVVGVAIDSTGQGDFMPDMFERESGWVDENSGLYRVKFSAVSKDIMYKNLKVTIQELLTTLPILDTKEAEKFREQMLDLQQEHKGQLLSVHHPDNNDAHDDYCFIASTLITTFHGLKPISDIRIGDYVLTRNGYKEVLESGCTGYRRVITRFGITGTPDHPFITKNGIRRFDNLNESDIIYIWNEKLSYIEEKSITEIPSLSIDSTEYTTGDMINGNSHQSHYIGRFGSITSVIYQKATSFITRMITLLTMSQKILSVCQEVNTSLYTQTNHIELLELKKQSRLHRRNLKNGTAVKKVRSGIENTPTIAYSKVYNLKVKDNHEYFVNNVLVHNCDSFALAEYAYAKWSENYINYAVVNAGEKERKVEKNEDGKVTDYWPNADWE